MIGFRFEIKYPSYSNPPGTKEKLEKRLEQEMVNEKKYELYIGCLGGMLYTYGVLWKEETNLNEQDRIQFLNWLDKQQVYCEAIIGNLEEIELIDINADFEGEKVKIDNLSGEDKERALQNEKKIEEMLLKWKTDGA